MSTCADVVTLRCSISREGTGGWDLKSVCFFLFFSRPCLAALVPGQWRNRASKGPRTTRNAPPLPAKSPVNSSVVAKHRIASLERATSPAVNTRSSFGATHPRRGCPPLTTAIDHRCCVACRSAVL